MFRPSASAGRERSPLADETLQLETEVALPETDFLRRAPFARQRGKPSVLVDPHLGERSDGKPFGAPAVDELEGLEQPDLRRGPILGPLLAGEPGDERQVRRVPRARALEGATEIVDEVQ